MKNTQVCQTLINAWLQDYQQLHDILNSEQLALEKRDFERLELIVREKDRAIGKITRHDIPPMVDHTGVQLNTLSSLQNFCESHSDLNTTWCELIELVKKCRLKNEVNSRLVNLLNISTRRTFNLIKGFDPDNNIYNASGNRATVRFNNNSISA